jgi:hypothetical protein
MDRPVNRRDRSCFEFADVIGLLAVLEFDQFVRALYAHRDLD